jgi:D-sedoheptulose 7-phosphate isomerase
MTGIPAGVPADIRALYPYLYAGEAGEADQSAQAELLAESARSALAKTAEISALRARLAAADAPRIAACAADMAAGFAAGGRLFTFGNGGSSTDAQDAATTFLQPWTGRALPALCLTCDVAVVTALSNDVGFDVVFARQIAALGRRDDIALGLSTSGGSANVIRAFEEAARRGLLTIGLAGSDGGPMAELDILDHLIVIPSSSVHRIQEAQTTVYHVLWELIQKELAAKTGGGR